LEVAVALDLKLLLEAVDLGGRIWAVAVAGRWVMGGMAASALLEGLSEFGVIAGDGLKCLLESIDCLIIPWIACLSPR
jgi:hypothetical protein